MTGGEHAQWRDEVVRAADRESAASVSLEVLLSALDGGDEWEIDTARRLAVDTLNKLREGR